MPALPLDEAGKYVAAAYLVFLTLLIVYVAIMGAKVARMEREIGELLELTDNEEAGRSPAVKARQDGEQSSQTAGQDGPSEVIHPGGSRR